MSNVLVYFSSSFADIALNFEDNSLIKVIFNNKLLKIKLYDIYKAKIVDKSNSMGCFFVDLGENNLGILKFHKKNLHYIKGESLLVQVIKEPIADSFNSFKNCVVSDDIFLMSSFFIYKPFGSNLIFSKNISDNEKKDLSNKINLKNGGGFIRSSYKFNNKEVLISQINDLQDIWKDIFESNKSGFIYSEDFFQRALFDNSKRIPSSVYIKSFGNINKEYCNNLGIKINHYFQKESILDFFNIKNELEILFSKNIYINDSLSLSITENEAFNYIDVNFKNDNFFTSKEESLYKANTDILKNIIDVIILKNLSGQILIDLLKVNNKQYKDNIVNCAKRYLSADGIKSFVLGFSNLGLLEISRQKMQISFNQDTDFLLAIDLMIFYTSLEHYLSTHHNKAKIEISECFLENLKIKSQSEFVLFNEKYSIDFICNNNVKLYNFF